MIWAAIAAYNIAPVSAEQQSSLDTLLNLSLQDLLDVPITSTAYYTETALDVASTVSVISHQDWEQRGARRLQDAYSNLPGVISLPNFLGSYALIIRGYAQADARGVATLWDGVPISTFNFATADVDHPNIQLNSLNSIEVIRGPGSALYGSDAFHGVVSLKPFQSEADVNRFSFKKATNGFFSGAYNNSVSLTPGLRLNFSLATSGQPDQNAEYTYTDANTGETATGIRDYKYQSTTAVLKLVSDPNKTFSIDFGLYYDDNNQDNFHGEGGQGFTPDRDISSVDSHLGMSKLDVKYRISQTSGLTLNGYYWNQDHVFERPVTATRDITIKADEHRYAMSLLYQHDQLFGNTHFTAVLGTRNDTIDNAHRRIYDAFNTIVDADLPFSGVKRHINSFSMDGKTSYTDAKLIFRYGFRLDDYSDFGSQFTPRLGIIYQLDKQSAIKALYGNAFRAPTAIEVGGTPFIAGDPNIQPEQIDTYELVYLHQSKQTKTELVLFESHWTDAITSADTDGDGIDDTFVNRNENNAQGVEVTYLREVNYWTVNASGSYVQSESETTGIDFTAFPKYILNLGIRYSEAPDWGILINNRVHLDAHDQPESSNLSDKPLKDYWRMDLTLTHSYQRWQIITNIRNVFDRKNYLPSLVNVDGGIPDERRSVDIGVQVSF
ncbi:MAG: TonB-dependent receptor [Gammaproteobacteria bacterium]|nr:TonB-dependent receptor [Gammaproteobacteria bacterium]